MMNGEILPPALLKRKAVVYIRQSTPLQVQVNLESQRRQYELVDEARRHGFRDVEVIDDDLGRSASGTVARPGFEKLVAWLCAGDVGAVLVSTPPAWPGTVGIGTIFSSSAALWKPGSSISTACIIPVGPMIGCFSA
jgi:hypothetical protein